MYMIGFSDRGAGGANSPPAVSTTSPSTPAHVEGARLSPSAKRDANIAEPRRPGGPILYAMGVFNPCLPSHRAIWTAEADAEVQIAAARHGLAPDIWMMRAFPRSTKICATVFGNVTTSSFFSRYVVSIPANGGKSSRTWTRT